MSKFQRGDILEWDPNHKAYNEITSSSFANDGPFVFCRVNDRSGVTAIFVKRLNNNPFGDGRSEVSFYQYRFRINKFLDAARKAIQDA